MVYEQEGLKNYNPNGTKLKHRNWTSNGSLGGHVQDEQHLWGFGVENFTNKRWQQDRQRHKDKHNSKEGKRSKQHKAKKHGDPQTWEHILILFYLRHLACTPQTGKLIGCIYRLFRLFAARHWTMCRAQQFQRQIHFWAGNIANFVLADEFIGFFPTKLAETRKTINQ